LPLSIATFPIGGRLEEKLQAIAAAGFNRTERKFDVMAKIGTGPMLLMPIGVRG
jgi:hypothetical protein